MRVQEEWIACAGRAPIWKMPVQDETILPDGIITLYGFLCNLKDLYIYIITGDLLTANSPVCWSSRFVGLSVDIFEPL